MYTQELFSYFKRPFWHVLHLKSIGLPCFTFATIIIICSLQIILLWNYSVTYNFSTCRHYLAENHLSFPFAPRLVWHSYLSQRATIEPIYLWVISVQCYLCIMHVHDRCCSLAGRFPTYLLAFACTKWEFCLYIKNLKPKLFQMSPPYLPICGITLPSWVNLHVPSLTNFK